MKPLYIESDEEVTSVIDRLRAQTQDGNILVVPAGATILQSAINMRLLLREAHKSGKAIAVVTADEYGRTLAEKVGIPVYATLEEVPTDVVPDAGDDADAVATYDDQPRQRPQIGSASYYESPQQRPAAYQPSASIAADPLPSAAAPVAHDDTQLDREWGEALAQQQVTQRPAASRAVAMDLRPQNTMIGATPSQPAVQPTMPAQQPVAAQATVAAPAYRPVGDDTLPQDREGRHDREVQAFFGRGREEASPVAGMPSHDLGMHGSIASYAHVPDAMDGKRRGRRLWLLGGFGLAGAAALAGAAVVVFYPKVTVVLEPTVRHETLTTDISADAARTAVDVGGRQIGLSVMEGSLEQSGQFVATGVASAAGAAKSRGKVVISNAFGPQPQPLVATTRLTTPDGKLFRLVKGVTVPGMKDGTPGTVTADVVADQPGASYDIAPSTFTIPGFKDTPKYEKFSAKSDAAMTGGNNGDSATATVSADDIARAKKETEEKAATALREKMIADAAAQGRKVLPDAVNVTFAASGTPSAEGATVASFDYAVKATAKALAFNEEDVRGMLRQELQSRADQGVHAKELTLTYSPSLPDYDKQTLTIKVAGALDLYPTIDTAAVRDALAGKKKDDLNGILSKFGGIQEANIHYKSGFLMGRLPWYKGSITVEVSE